MNAAVVQYVKGAIATAETAAFARFGAQIEWHRMGEGFHWITQDAELDRKAAERAWDLSCQLMARPDLGMLILDELVVSLRLRQLEESRVLAALESKRADLARRLDRARRERRADRACRSRYRDEDDQASLPGRDPRPTRYRVLRTP